MIPRLLVPKDARPPAADTPSTRRRPTSMDERTLVPAMLPVVPLDGRTNIPSSLPLDSIARRVVVPRDVKWEEIEVHKDNGLPLQPTDLDKRITVPQGAAPPEIITPLENVPRDLVDLDVFMTGEVNLLSKPPQEENTRASLITRISSIAAHILFIALIVLQPKLFPVHQRTQQEIDLGNRQITVLLPPGALESPRATPKPKQPTVRVDPRIIRKVAPPEPTPEPAPKEPEHVVKELPSAPKPQPNATPPTPEPSAPVAKTDSPKPTPKLEAPEQPPAQNGLILPRGATRRSLQDSIREAARMDAPTAIGGGGGLPNDSGIPSSGGHGTAYGNMEMLTPTEGVDFNNYLQRVYVTVKQNWFSVMPESVFLGDKGVVSLQFRIMKDGTVPVGDPQRVFGSGKEPLDRAAVSSIRASTPFEPLPGAFKGPYIELRFTYYYNLQPDNAH